MPISQKYLAEFRENCTYHVYNTTNNRELLFIEDENYIFFLEKYNQYLTPFLDTYCYNLLPNHFHLMIKIKPEISILSDLRSREIQQLSLTEKLFLQNKIPVNQLLVKMFTRFFQSYSQSFNKTYDRKGNLFYKPFKRIEISDESQFTQTMVYIHANAMKHGLTKDFTKYKWSSWQSLLSSKPTKLLRYEGLEWFGGKESFIKTHIDLSDFYYNNDIEE